MVESKLAVKSTAVVVFIIPIIASIVLGSTVMVGILDEPDRELNMMQFKLSKAEEIRSDSIKIESLEKQYTTNTPIEIQVSITDDIFDCGDLYITIYDLSTSTKQVITQSGFFGQCFVRDNSFLPVDDKFSEKIVEPGDYEIVVEMNDKHYQQVVSTSQKFSVK